MVAPYYPRPHVALDDEGRWCASVCRFNSYKLSFCACVSLCSRHILSLSYCICERYGQLLRYACCWLRQHRRWGITERLWLFFVRICCLSVHFLCSSSSQLSAKPNRCDDFNYPTWFITNTEYICHSSRTNCCDSFRSHQSFEQLKLIGIQKSCINEDHLYHTQTLNPNRS